MRRRTVLALLAGTMAPWPPMVVAESVGRLRNIGVLIGLAETDPEVPRCVAIFQQALRDLGWIDGYNIRIHYRSTFEADRLRVLGNELVALQPDVIVASSSIAAGALLRETRTIPIVFVTASDPVGDGFVASLAQPNGNATGFNFNLSLFYGKCMELLREIVPGSTHFTALCNSDSASAGSTYFLPALPSAAA